jgi:xanthine dehydrogenase YagR molybdenum-binding subunit
VLAASQVRGGVIQGLGAALYEARLLDPSTGGLVSANLEDYRIPGIGDAPEMAVEFDEGGFEHVNGQGIGLAELVTVPVAASIANAVRAATGWGPRTLPLRPDRVLAALGAPGAA